MPYNGSELSLRIGNHFIYTIIVQSCSSPSIKNMAGIMIKESKSLRQKRIRKLYIVVPRWKLGFFVLLKFGDKIMSSKIYWTIDIAIFINLSANCLPKVWWQSIITKLTLFFGIKKFTTIKFSHQIISIIFKINFSSNYHQNYLC